MGENRDFLSSTSGNSAINKSFNRGPHNGADGEMERKIDKEGGGGGKAVGRDLWIFSVRFYSLLLHRSMRVWEMR